MKKQTLNRCPPKKIAKSVEKCDGNNSVTSIKPYKSGILVECKTTKQLDQLSQIQEVAGVPVKIQPRTTLLRGVMYEISTDVDDEELLQELKSQNVDLEYRIFPHPYILLKRAKFSPRQRLQAKIKNRYSPYK